MDRTLLKCSLIISILSSAPSHAQLSTFDFNNWKQLRDVVKTGSKTLNQLQSMSSELQTMNTVLGSKLNAGWLNKIMKVGNLSGDFSAFLSSMTGEGGDPLSQVNYMGVQHGGKRDFSNYLFAKDYFQQKFFPEQIHNSQINLEQIRDSKLEAAQVSTIDSLSIATQQKRTLREDHIQLQNIKQQAAQNSTLQYQTNVQTKLLEHIAHQLDKLILIESQQLELMATYMAQAQPTVFKKVGMKKQVRK